MKNGRFSSKKNSLSFSSYLLFSSYDFLQKAFDMFPDRDYCVITIPQMVPEFPLLQSFIVYFNFHIVSFSI